MEKHLVVIFGPGNVGKTTSIKKAEKELGQKLLSTGFSRQIIGRRMSLEIRVRYISVANNMHVGFFSRGDVCGDVYNNLSKLSDCQIIFCAARSTKFHINNILTFATKNGYTVIPLFKLEATDKDNVRIVEEIKNNVKEISPFKNFNPCV